MKPLRFTLLMSMLLVALSSCVHLPLHIPHSSQENKSPSINNFDIEGRAILSYTLDGKRRVDSFNWSWKQSLEQYQFRLFHLLKHALIEGKIGGGATFTFDGKEASYPNFETLLLVERGWMLPSVEVLRFWILGKPFDPLHTEPFDASKAQGFAQSGWKISFLRYKKFAGHELPAKIQLEKGGVRVVILINRWSFG